VPQPNPLPKEVQPNPEKKKREKRKRRKPKKPMTASNREFAIRNLFASGSHPAGRQREKGIRGAHATIASSEPPVAVLEKKENSYKCRKGENAGKKNSSGKWHEKTKGR